MTKIMLVEDDKSLREIYDVRLRAEGYDIKYAGDGEEALAMAVKEHPDLIISDVMMPKISGFDMLDILRATPETKAIKVIMMTALSSEDQRTRGESLGADRYLVKSQVGIEDVVRTVHEVLGDIPSLATSSSAEKYADMQTPVPVPTIQTEPQTIENQPPINEGAVLNNFEAPIPQFDTDTLTNPLQTTEAPNSTPEISVLSNDTIQLNPASFVLDSNNQQPIADNLGSKDSYLQDNAAPTISQEVVIPSSDSYAPQPVFTEPQQIVQENVEQYNIPDTFASPTLNVGNISDQDLEFNAIVKEDQPEVSMPDQTPELFNLPTPSIELAPETAFPDPIGISNELNPELPQPTAPFSTETPASLENTLINQSSSSVFQDIQKQPTTINVTSIPRPTTINVTSIDTSTNQNI